MTGEDAVEETMGIIRSIASKYFDGRTEYDDLVQAGVEGTLIALSKFDPARGTKFSTFAWFWIRKYIIDAQSEPYVIVLEDVEESSSMEDVEDIAEPSTFVAPVSKALSILDNTAKQVLELKYGFVGGWPRTRREIASELGLSERSVRRIESGALRTLRKHPEIRHLIP